MSLLSKQLVYLIRILKHLLLITSTSCATLGVKLTLNAQSRAPMASSQPQIGISIDTRRNEAFIKADDLGESFVYTAVRSGDVISVQLASKELMAIWKGGAPIAPVAFEMKDQFAPAFLVADIRNDTSFPINVVNTYLFVNESTTDYHPYLGTNSDTCSDGSYNPRIEIQNFGWGDVIQPKLTYTFSAKNVRSRVFESMFPTFSDELAGTVEGALRQAGANVSAMKRGNYSCSSAAALPSCFARLKQSRIFGALADNVFTDGGDTVQSNVSGTLDYSWLDSKGISNKSKAAFNITVELGKFAVSGPECGGSGPISRTERAIILPLDRQQYRIPLNWHGRMLSRQEQKFGLSLASLKSSRHVFRVVLQLSDGRVISSPLIDLSYFTPKIK